MVINMYYYGIQIFVLISYFFLSEIKLCVVQLSSNPSEKISLESLFAKDETENKLALYKIYTLLYIYKYYT